VDLVNEICREYEESDSITNSKGESVKKENEKVYELLAKMQELGQPPAELMKKLQEKHFPEMSKDGNPFTK